MPVIHVARLVCGAEAIAEMRERCKGDNSAEGRRQYVSGVNMLPDGAVDFSTQMGIYWSKADARHKVEIVQFMLPSKTNMEKVGKEQSSP